MLSGILLNLLNLIINYLDEVTEGYIKETHVTPSGKKTLRITAPDGQKFRTIKSAQESVFSNKCWHA